MCDLYIQGANNEYWEYRTVENKRGSFPSGTGNWGILEEAEGMLGLEHGILKTHLLLSDPWAQMVSHLDLPCPLLFTHGLMAHGWLSVWKLLLSPLWLWLRMVAMEVLFYFLPVPCKPPLSQPPPALPTSIDGLCKCWLIWLEGELFNELCVHHTCCSLKSWQAYWTLYSSFTQEGGGGRWGGTENWLHFVLKECLREKRIKERKALYISEIRSIFGPDTMNLKCRRIRMPTLCLEWDLIEEVLQITVIIILIAKWSAVTLVILPLEREREKRRDGREEVILINLRPTPPCSSPSSHTEPFPA